MSRTFSLGRLMVGITAFGIFCGVAVNYPFALLVFVVFAIPLAILWIALVVLFRHKTGATIAAVFAAIAGLILSDPFFPSIGVFLLVGAVLSVKRYVES